MEPLPEELANEIEREAKNYLFCMPISTNRELQDYLFTAREVRGFTKQDFIKGATTYAQKYLAEKQEHEKCNAKLGTEKSVNKTAQELIRILESENRNMRERLAGYYE